MKKYKLLYFISEDEYFLSHKIFQAKDALKNKFDVMIICNFTKHENRIRSEGFKTENINFDRKSVNPFKNLICLIKLLKIIYTFKPNLIQCFALKPILLTSMASFFNKHTKILCCVVRRDPFKTIVTIVLNEARAPVPIWRVSVKIIVSLWR